MDISGVDGCEMWHHFVGSEYAKVMHIKAGQTLAQHKHRFDHDSALLCGVAQVCVAGECATFKGPVLLHVKAHEEHQVTALTDLLWACLWTNPTGETEPEKFDHTVIEEGKD